MRLSTMAGLGVLAAAGGAAHARFVRPGTCVGARPMKKPRWPCSIDELRARSAHRREHAARDHHRRAAGSTGRGSRSWARRRPGSTATAGSRTCSGAICPNAREVVLRLAGHQGARDKNWLHPKVALDVVIVEPGRTLVLSRHWSFHHLGRWTTSRAPGSIVFAIVATSSTPRSTAAIPTPSHLGTVASTLYWRAFSEPAHFVMERRMRSASRPWRKRLALQ